MTSMPPISLLSALPVSLSFIPSDNQELSDAITRLAGHINAAHYRFLKLLAALIEREAWLGDSGMKSPAHWLNYYCGIDLGAAREKVRVAKCLAALPQIDEAFRSGAISYSKVRAMTRSATPANEGHLLQVAKYGTAQHVEKLVRKFERAKRLNDPRQEQSQHDAREFTWYYDDDGMLVFKGRLAAEEGAAFMRAMDLMLQSIYTSNQVPTTPDDLSEATEESQQEGSADAGEEWQQEDSLAKTAGDNPELAKNVSAEASFPEIAGPTFAQKRADALVAMADFAISNFTAGAKPATSADKYQVIVHIDAKRAKSLSAETWSRSSCATNNIPTEPHEHAVCSMESNGCHFPLAATAVRRLACDASLVAVLEDETGNVLNIGRKTRAIPPSIRRALHLRDQGCRFPGCCEMRFVDAHHIHHWCDGGETKLDNLVLLCRYHHGLLHREGYDIVKDAGSIVFILADGRTMDRALSPQFTGMNNNLNDTLCIEDEAEAADLGIDSRTAVTAWRGETMDYDFAVGTLMDIRDSCL